MEKKSLEISWASLWRILFFVVLVSLMYLGRRILLGLFLAVVISSGLEFMVNIMERRGVPRVIGVILIFVAALLLVIVTVYAVIPLVIVDLNIAFSTLNKLAQNSWWGPLISLETTQSIGTFINKISGQFIHGGASTLGTVSDILGSIILAASVLMTSFYLSLSKDGVERFILAVFPADTEEAALRVYDRARRKIGSWFQAQIILSCIVGILVLIALLTLGVRYAFLLGLLAAILEIVPFVGPVLSGAAAFVIASISSPALAFYTLVVFFVIHQIENHLLVPLFVGRNVGLHPVIVIISLLIGIEVGGFLGVLVAVPAAAVIQEIIEEWSSKKKIRQPAFI